MVEIVICDTGCVCLPERQRDLPVHFSIVDKLRIDEQDPLDFVDFAGGHDQVPRTEVQGEFSVGGRLLEHPV